jgi:hypothetical protein
MSTTDANIIPTASPTTAAESTSGSNEDSTPLVMQIVVRRDLLDVSPSAAWRIKKRINLASMCSHLSFLASNE